MDITKIIALSKAGFSAEDIEKMVKALDPAIPPDDPEEENEEPDAEQPEEHQDQHDDPNGPPAWFGKFLERYNEDISQLSKGLKATNVRRAGSDDGGSAVKTPEQMMAEAFNNLR